MKPLEAPDSHHLIAAQGWLELGNCAEANQELDKLSPAAGLHPDALEVRWQVCAKTSQWQECADIGLALMKAAPNRADGWIHRSYALHELKRTKEAYANLAAVAEKFSSLWAIPYNLCCYCSQLSQFDEARSWLKRAALLNSEAVQKAALNDPDLKPLWNSISTTIGKKTSS